MTATQIERSSYRPEVQGIRTIGALLVAIFHIWGGRVSGGVDVFFVISGFLITGSLYRELHKTGTLHILAFWGRIAKRVAPMAYTVLAFTLLAALLWLPQTRQEGFLSEILYSAFHIENIKLMMNSVDYLARDEAPSPVQQFWALSVQVQFYAVWPFLLLTVALAARKLRTGASTYIVALVAVFLASLAYSIVQTRLDPAPTYFNTLARVWEFALGGLIAVALPRLALPPMLRLVAGWVGLALVVSCGFVFSRSAAFPGYVSLWPTIGAALVLLSGSSGIRFGADRLLAARPLVALGDMSFAFYLWHWPVLIFALLISGKTQLGLQAGLQVIAIALAGAYVTTRWLEQPIQRSSIGKRKVWHVHAMAAGFAAPILAVAVVWAFLLGNGENSESLPVADYPGGTISASLETMIKPGVPLRPDPAAAKRDFARVLLKDCHQSQSKATVVECAFGRLSEPTKTIALVGGSHSSHWFPALEVLAEKYGWRIVNITKSACPLMVGGEVKLNSTCIEWNKNVISTLASLKPDVVFTTSTRRRNVHGRREEYIPVGYQEQWSRLAKVGVSVIAVRDNPWMGFHVPECIEENSSNPMACSRPRNEILSNADPASALSPKPANVDFIDLTDRFCDESTCFPASGNLIVYSDRHHINVTFSRTLATTLGERMKQVRPDLFPVEARNGTDNVQSAEAGN